MNVTYTERCPNCGKLIYRDAVERSKSFGNSLQVCNYCQRQYFDSKVYEWVNLTNEEKKSVLVLGTNMTIVNESEMRSLYKKMKFTKYLLVGLPIVRKLEKQIEQFNNFKFEESMLLNTAIQESIARTANKEYLIYLINKGRNYYGTDCTPNT